MTAAVTFQLASSSEYVLPTAEPAVLPSPLSYSSSFLAPKVLLAPPKSSSAPYFPESLADFLRTASLVLYANAAISTRS